MLATLGTAPIVSRAYDPNCKASLVGGIIRHIKKPGDRAKYFQALTLFVHCADCVDKDVITEMIDLGTNFASEYEDADAITNLIRSMIILKMDNGDAVQPNDSRTAFAIRAGLLDLCLNMIVRFGGANNARGIVAGVALILHNVYLLSFHKKTSKAIGDARGHLLKEFRQMKENQQLTNECKQALCMIQSIIAITSTNCFVCNKETERKDMKKCAACKSVCYCSEECQRKDWLSPHAQDCKTFIDGKDTLHSPLCSNEREAANLKDLERNIRMTQKRLYLGYADTIRLELAAKESRSEYVVHFDLGRWPLQPTLRVYTDFFLVI